MAWYVRGGRRARAALPALGVPGPGAHAVHLCAPETLVPFPTEELLRRYHPTARLLRPLPGRTAPVDTTAARRLLGFTAERLIDGPGESRRDFDAEERRTRPFMG
ncbi:hypothetical protein ACIRP2_14590 [Streptomyces sp. NPDC101194]|uniref:hypothetical protein n=1 Tax=Streptomyces sp. NPDC101194 TaxID=3366127 RepID=UPI00381DB5BF